MIKIHVFKKIPKIELTTPVIYNTYINFYVDGKFDSEKSFSFYKLLSLDELLNAKSISLEYIKKEIF